MSTITRRSLLALPLGGLLAACSGPTAPSATTSSPTSLPPRVADHGVDVDRLAMTVYKDASCGCCGGWVTHAEEHGFAITTELPDNLATVWTEHDIPLDLQSCHLARHRDGHLFVGHVPVRHVLEYLADPPKGARGLSVPAMPVGTPGMEQGDRFDPYSVMLITKGEPRVFAKVSSPADQEV
ncbi:MAG: hypothetical protein C0493_10870 [Kytococcus sp.]|nr:hypothetical protein [Kytococcus sp.]